MPSLGPVNDQSDPRPAGLSRWLSPPDALARCAEDVVLVDQQALRELEEDFDSPAVARDFARDFASSWEGKYQRLATCVQRRDQTLAKEAVLSVKVTSIMVGATRLAQLAVHLEQLLDDNDMDSAGRALAGVERCGWDTRAELLGTYIC